MVSFSCENCGDVLTKKKLDPHRNQCRGATYTCLDCMVHFWGTEYRTHTSCISEAQKYQGSTYKEKEKKGKPQRSEENNALVPRNPYVEDANDEYGGAVAVIDVPPRAPSPPPNVFDFLVEDQTPSRNAIEPPAAESHMLEDTRPPKQDDSKDLVPRGYHVEERMPGAFIDDGISYGSTPIAPSFERYDSYPELKTPAPKSSVREVRPSSTKPSKSDKKRKRTTVDALDMTAVQALADRDALMTDAPPVLHSGLTGGLNRLLSRPEMPPSPDYSGDWIDADASPLSPLKRNKHAHVEPRERGRDREAKPRRTSASKGRAVQMVQIKRRPRRDSRESKEKDHGKESRKPTSRKHRRDSSDSADRDRARSRSPRARTFKRIEYRVASGASEATSVTASAGDSKALVLHKSDRYDRYHDGGGDDGEDFDPHARARARLFASLVTKGPESERGLSVNKALKRFHRLRSERWEDGAAWGGGAKADEEKDLWKSVRLRRNERGEIVLML